MRDSPRLLVLTPDLPPARGGIQVVSHRLAAHLLRFEVSVVALARAGANEFDAQQRFSVRRTGFVRFPHQARVAALNASSLVEGLRFRPDVVLSMHIVTSPAARLLRAPVVQYLHADEMRGRPALTRFAMRHAAAVIAVSAHTESLALAEGADTTRLHRIPNGVDLPEGTAVQRSDEPLVVTVGRLTQTYKGHDVMLRAMPMVRQRVPDARWVVVGEGPLRHGLERDARSAGLAEAVTFVGAVSDEERDAWLDRGRVFVMPSRLPPGGVGGEGFGIAYLEASAHGLPVVAGNVGGALDAVVDGETGLLLDPTDPGAVADAVSGLLLDRVRAEALGNAGAARAREFEWPTIARRVEDLLLGVAR